MSANERVSGPLKIRTLGPIAVVAPDGADLTPSSQKACGLIALLCDAPEFKRSREMIQDKLWSDRAPPQGAASLRQCLTEIRRAFGPYRDVLVADARIVSLDKSRIESDLDDRAALTERIRAGAVFLDGIAARDVEFENWLRDKRLALEQFLDENEQVAAPGRAGGTTLERRPLVRRVPILIVGYRATTGSPVLAGHISHSIAKGVSDIGAVDLRMANEGAPLEMGEIQRSGTVYSLDATEQPLGDGVSVLLQLTTVPARQICWQRSEILPASELTGNSIAIARLINDGIDRTVAAFSGERLFGPLLPDDPAVSGTAATIRRMWMSAGQNPGALITELQESYDREGRGVHLAWEAFVWCFVVGERRQSDKTMPDAERLIRKAMELEPHNPLVLALASHVFGFVLRRFEVALDLAERSVRLDPHNILGWAFLGLARVNLKQKKGGYEAAARARAIAGEGPHRGFIDALMTAAAALSGRHDVAIPIGETSNALRPDFAATLRYLIASYVASGEVDRARMTALRLRKIEPDFEMSLLLETDYPAESIRRSGVLDLKKLPNLS